MAREQAFSQKRNFHQYLGSAVHQMTLSCSFQWNALEIASLL